MWGSHRAVFIRTGDLEVRRCDGHPVGKTHAGGEVERRGGEARSGVREVGADLVDEAGYYRGGSRGRVDDVAARREAV